MELELTADDPRPKAYLYTGGQSDYYFIVWMSSNPSVATVDGDGKVTARSVGTATITAISDHGERAACKVTVTRKGEEPKPKNLPERDEPEPCAAVQRVAPVQAADAPEQRPLVHLCLSVAQQRPQHRLGG